MESATNLFDLLNNGGFFIEEAQCHEELFRKMGQILYEQGYVKDGYFDAIMKREEKYPTGLVTEAFPICMPHVEAEYVKKNAVVIVKLEPPVAFQRMDDPTQQIMSELAFFIIIADKSSHTKAIASLARIFMSPETLRKIKSASSHEEILEIIRNQNCERKPERRECK